MWASESMDVGVFSPYYHGTAPDSNTGLSLGLHSYSALVNVYELGPAGEVRNMPPDPNQPLTTEARYLVASQIVNLNLHHGATNYGTLGNIILDNYYPTFIPVIDLSSYGGYPKPNTYYVVEVWGIEQYAIGEYYLTKAKDRYTGFDYYRFQTPRETTITASYTRNTPYTTAKIDATYNENSTIIFAFDTESEFNSGNTFNRSHPDYGKIIMEIHRPGIIVNNSYEGIHEDPNTFTVPNSRVKVANGSSHTFTNLLPYLDYNYFSEY